MTLIHLPRFRIFLIIFSDFSHFLLIFLIFLPLKLKITLYFFAQLEVEPSLADMSRPPLAQKSGVERLLVQIGDGRWVMGDG